MKNPSDYFKKQQKDWDKISWELGSYKTKRAWRSHDSIDPNAVLRLALIQCSQDEMASVLNTSVDTLQRDFSDVLAYGRAYVNASLRRKQYEVAMGGSVPMLFG